MIYVMGVSLLKTNALWAYQISYKINNIIKNRIIINQIKILVNFDPPILKSKGIIGISNINEKAGKTSFSSMRASKKTYDLLFL